MLVIQNGCKQFLIIVKPILYIIAGPNGAGKTTASFNVLPGILDCKEYVNADEIARGLSPFDVESVAVQAGRLMLERIEFLLSQKTNFAIETTLATRSYSNLINKAKAIGYEVHIIFFWLNSPEMAYQRVAKRVSEGGHDIPKEVIRRRYWLGIKNLFTIFMPIIDYWELYNNTLETRMIANSNEIIDPILFNYIKECQSKKERN